MNVTRINRRSICSALVTGFALSAGVALSGIPVAAADAPVALRGADVRIDLGRGAYYRSGGAPDGMVLTRANMDAGAEFGRSSVYAAVAPHPGTIAGAADPDRGVWVRPDPARPGRQ